MALAMLTGYMTKDAGQSFDDWLAAHPAYTHTCGYTRAWPDATDATLVYLLPDCPVDAYLTQLQTQLSAYVVDWYNRTDTEPDPHRRVLTIISGVIADANTWSVSHAPEEITLFLTQSDRMHGYVVAELITQGVLA